MRTGNKVILKPKHPPVAEVVEIITDKWIRIRWPSGFEQVVLRDRLEVVD